MQKLLTNFQQKYWRISDINVGNFNETLTNDVVGFEQRALVLMLALIPEGSLQRAAMTLIYQSRHMYSCFVCLMLVVPLTSDLKVNWYTSIFFGHVFKGRQFLRIPVCLTGGRMFPKMGLIFKS